MSNGVARNLVVVAAILGLQGLPALPGAPKSKEAEKADALAEEAVKQFDKALVAKDVDGVLAVVDTPFYWGPEEPPVDRDRLRKLLVKLFRDKDFKGAKLTVVESTTYGELAPKLDKKDKDSLDKLADPKDRVVLVKDAASGSEALSGTLVRVREGKARVIGLFRY